jgi:hypothetical protein
MQTNTLCICIISFDICPGNGLDISMHGYNAEFYIHRYICTIKSLHGYIDLNPIVNEYCDSEGSLGLSPFVNGIMMYIGKRSSKAVPSPCPIARLLPDVCECEWPLSDKT